MKKTLLITALMILAAPFASAHDFDCKCNKPCKCPPPYAVKKAPPKMDFAKLNLTDEQKVKAREIRMNGHKEIVPLFQELKTKKDQKRAIMNDTTTTDKQLKQIKELNDDIFALKHQIHQVQRKNAQEFESILTDEQKQTLKQMKADARKEFKKQYRCKGHRPCPCRK